jgi:aerobic carbon-monoxide dehydrogenase medium subunit
MRVLKPFDYFEPETVEEASEYLTSHGGKAWVLAGGVDLIPRLRRGKINTDALVNIQKIPALDVIEANEAGLKFGAMVRLRSLEASKIVRENCPALYDAIHQISSIQVKHMGTVVGNICVATPASDLATALIALGAELTIAGADGQRKEPLEAFYIEYGRTSLVAGEIVTEIILPNPSPGTGTAFLNLVRTHGDIAKVNVAVSVTMNEGICGEARIAVGAVAPIVFRATKAEALLKGQELNPEIIRRAGEAAAGETKPITDLRSTADYRRQMTGVLVRRALEKALEKRKA